MNSRFYWNTNCKLFQKTLAPIIFCCLVSALYSQNKAEIANNKKTDSDNVLIKQYIESKGKNIITFDATNIKQYWIDNTVACKDNSVIVLLKNSNKDYEGTPLKIQLANVNETLDCKIECISDCSDYNFTVLNDKMKPISESIKDASFIDYSIITSSFHLENTLSYSFFLKFHSNKTSQISLKRIILSFSNNKNTSFLSSPGVLKINAENIETYYKTTAVDSNSFSITGTRTEFLSHKKIYVSNNTIHHSVTIKNIGNTPTTVYCGYAPYTKEHKRIHRRNVPYKDINKVLKVVESKADSNSIIVDSYSDWTKGCYIAINAKEDLSDFPNFSILENPIVNVKALDSSYAEITFKEPIKQPIAKGTFIRIQSPHGDTYIYNNHKVLQPGEEVKFESSIQKDESYLSFSSWAFSRGTYYIVPLLLSYSINEDEANTILIKDYTVSY